MRIFILISLLAAAAPCQTIRSLPVVGDQYPRAFFFRSSEGMASNARVSYDEWDKTFSRLMGIEGKVLDEEIPGRSARNIEFFTRFKQRHPDQLVMLHFNGNARDPRFEAGAFFAGHWLYYNGATVLADLPAQAGEGEIPVSDTRLFRTNMGRYRNANEDLAICAINPAGRPDWNACEQVQLLAINAAQKTIRVRRGAYGTAPRQFSAGRARVAAHVTEGPWGNNSHLLWAYNYSLRSPRDRNGRQCGEILADDLARRFAAGGALAAFDGLEFDVLHNAVPRRDKTRGVDTDGDGTADAGEIDGVNYYGLGVIDFCRRLRAKMGPTRLILADGMSRGNQRAFGVLNGIESEGFPELRDKDFEDWSGGLNRHFFWDANAFAPVFNYINHKFNDPDPTSKLPVVPEIPFSSHRLVFAAAAFTNAAVCYSLMPPKAADELAGIWDELRTPWLGKPLGPAVRMAERQRPVAEWKTAPGMKLTVPVRGPDLYVRMMLSQAPGIPPRLVTVSVGGRESMTWVNGRPFTATFYFPNVTATSADVEIAVEGNASLTITRVAAYAHPDAIYREFERGLVLANPSPRPYTFDFGTLFPGRRYRRLKGSANQDARTNDGSPVASSVTLGARDALFLRRD